MNRKGVTKLAGKSLTRCRHYGAILLLTALAVSCNLPKPATKLKLKVSIAEKANQNSAVQVDLVLVSDKNLLKDLIKMPASEWFEKRRQIKRDFPDAIGLSDQPWEWVPGQDVDAITLPMRRNVSTALIFANYLTPGAHRIRVDPRKPIHLRLLDDHFEVGGQGK